jgi:hypothetical protein
VSNSEPFYLPRPDLLAHADAYREFTNFAARLKAAGLSGRFPPDTQLRHTAIELLAGRHSVEDLAEEPYLIQYAVDEARACLDER